jgi:hypothetical protein
MTATILLCDLKIFNLLYINSPDFLPVLWQFIITRWDCIRSFPLSSYRKYWFRQHQSDIFADFLFFYGGTKCTNFNSWCYGDTLKCRIFNMNIPAHTGQISTILGLSPGLTFIQQIYVQVTIFPNTGATTWWS